MRTGVLIKWLKDQGVVFDENFEQRSQGHAAVHVRCSSHESILPLNGSCDPLCEGEALRVITELGLDPAVFYEEIESA